MTDGRNSALNAVTSADSPSAAAPSETAATPDPALHASPGSQTDTSSPAPSDNAPGAPGDGDRSSWAAWRDAVIASLEDDKALDVVEIDLAGKSSVTDLMVVASGRSQRHVAALADHVLRRLKETDAKNVRVEGLAAADWVLIDAGDVVVHLFRPEVREFYNLERLWEADADTARATG